MRIHGALMTQNELSDLAPNVEALLPHVHTLTVIDGGSSDLTIPYMRNLARRNPKVNFIISPWEDDFPKQRNKYVAKIKEFAEPGDWLATCYDCITEVLTDNGWKLFSETDILKDQFMTHNMLTGKLEWQIANRKIDQEYHGDLLLYDEKGCNFAVTPDHKMIVRKDYVGWSKKTLPSYLSKYKPIRAENLSTKKKYKILRSGVWSGLTPSFQIVTGLSNEHLLTFIGWYLSEGWSYKNGFRKKIQISQVKIGTRNEIINLIREMGCTPIFEPSPHEDTITFYHSTLWDYLQQFGKNAYTKKIPKEIKDLDSDLLRLMFYSYAKGDGSPNGNGYDLCTASPELSDDMQEICMKIGMRCTIRKQPPVAGGFNKKGKQIIGTVPMYYMTVNLEDEYTVEGKKVQRIEYSGKVYCVTVPNGTLVVRRRGRSMICGNCDPDEFYAQNTLDSLPELIAEAERMGKTMIGLQCISQTYMGNEVVYNNLDAYHKTLIMKWFPDFRYGGFKVHESKDGIPHDIWDVHHNYYHRKQADVIWIRGFRNLVTGGGGPNLGHSNPRWGDLRQRMDLAGYQNWHELYKGMLKGNLDPQIKEWMLMYYNLEGFDGSSEHREASLSYFVTLHPEECATLSQEHQDYFRSKGARW